MRNTGNSLRCLSVGVLFGLGTWQTLADGFRNPPDTAAALGRSGAVVAWTDDASAVFFNPANLVDLTSCQVQLSALAGYSHAEYLGKLGSTETTSPWSVLPEFAFASPLSGTDWAIGFGFDVPYGRSTKWESDGIFRYAAPVSTELMVADFTPTLSWRATDALSVGAGLDIYYGRLQLCQLMPYSSRSQVTADGDGYTVGGNAGITWRITPDQRLALTCHAPFDMTFDGELETTAVPSPAVASSSFETTFNFPTIVALGYGIRLTDTVRVEADVEWLQYSRYKSLKVSAGENDALVQSLGLADVSEDWHDTWTFGVGPEWQFAKRWTLRAGYKYLQSPISDYNFSPSMLDVDQSLVSVGLGYQHGRHTIDLAYAVGIFTTRRVDNNQSSLYETGAYDFEGHLVALTYTLSL